MKVEFLAEGDGGLFIFCNARAKGERIYSSGILIQGRTLDQLCAAVHATLGYRCTPSLAKHGVERRRPNPRKNLWYETKRFYHPETKDRITVIKKKDGARIYIELSRPKLFLGFKLNEKKLEQFRKVIARGADWEVS